jgi:hypothetical protein
MSKIALTPNASGSGTFTIASPNSDTDRTLTLPDEAGTVLTSASSVPQSYATGFWTWGLEDSLGNACTIRSGYTRGAYTKIGNVVFCTGKLEITSAAALTSGNKVRITNLPYTSATDSTDFGYYTGFGIDAKGLSITAGESLFGVIVENVSYVELRLYDDTGGVTDLTSAEVTSGFQCALNFFYMTDS